MLPKRDSRPGVSAGVELRRRELQIGQHRRAGPAQGRKERFTYVQAFCTILEYMQARPEALWSRHGVSLGVVW